MQTSLLDLPTHPPSRSHPPAVSSTYLIISSSKSRGGGSGGSSSGHACAPSGSPGCAGSSAVPSSSVGSGGIGSGGGGSGAGDIGSGAAHNAREFLFPGDTAFVTRLLAGVKAGKGESWARCECHDYTQGMVNLALDRESGLLGVLSAPGALLKVTDK